MKTPKTGTPIEELRQKILMQKKLFGEVVSFSTHLKNADNEREGKMISYQIEILKTGLRKSVNDVVDVLGRIYLFKPLKKGVDEFDIENIRVPEEITKNIAQNLQIDKQKVSGVAQSLQAEKKKSKPDSLEKLTLSRLKKKKEKVLKVKERKPRRYVKMASRFFHNYSTNLINKGKFQALSRDLIKANMDFVPAAYVSVIFFTAALSIFAAFLIMIFFLFFNVVALPPFIVQMQEGFAIRFLKVFWLLFAIPATTFAFCYYYPSMERKSIENRINQELPFAVVHMSAISSSMIEPSKIFNIIVLTREYPALEKEFIKIQNEINVYGYDLVTALRNRSFNSPSKKLSELFNGLATTINSGGNLPEFFEKRSQSLLFEHRLEKEKQGKASETFMDIYISAVIAAPMILMLVLMMMRISGIGISLSTGMISFIMILAVSLINILFLAFLKLKQPGEV